MKKVFTLFLAIFIMAMCTSCEYGTYTSSNPNYYEETQSAEELPTVVYITATGTKYHKEDCQYLKYSKCKTFQEDAINSGYIPCSVCNP